MIHRFVFHNEELKTIDKVRWSPGQAGLICGWGLFTTVRIVRGEAFAYERHWRRLEKDAALTRLPLNYSNAKVKVLLYLGGDTLSIDNSRAGAPNLTA